jgi:hypothetical protein
MRRRLGAPPRASLPYCGAFRELDEATIPLRAPRSTRPVGIEKPRVGGITVAMAAANTARTLRMMLRTRPRGRVAPCLRLYRNVQWLQSKVPDLVVTKLLVQQAQALHGQVRCVCVFLKHRRESHRNASAEGTLVPVHCPSHVGSGFTREGSKGFIRPGEGRRRRR